MKSMSCGFILRWAVMLISLWLIMPLAQAQAPWPDAGSANPTTNWTAYTSLGVPIHDVAGSPDQSTGGTTPQQDADVVSTNGVASTWYAYSAATNVLFIRLHLATSPLTQTPNGGSGDDPFDAVTWSLLIDSDGDGYKEFAVQLNGDTGTNTDQYDNLSIFYDNRNNQSLLTGAVPIYAVKSASFPVAGQDQDPRATYWDYGRARAIEPAATGGGWFLDWQIPISGFNGIINQTTPVAFAFGTSNSNTNPLQKDFAFEGVFGAGDTTKPIPFGDTTTISGTPTQSPYVREVTVTGCGPATVSARVTDTQLVSGTTVSSSIASVKFYYQPDDNGDGVPNAGSSPVLFSTVTTPTSADINVFQTTWSNNQVAPASYVVFVEATDKQGNTTNSLNASPAVYAIDQAACGTSSSVSGRIYNDVNHNGSLDNGESGLATSGFFVKVVPSTGGNALVAAPVDATTGTYSVGMVAGNYNLVLDNNNILTDTTPTIPTGTSGTEAATGVRPVIVAPNGAFDQNFGRYSGATITGRVFRDDGSSGGTANNGVADGGEVGISTVTVRAQSSDGSTNHDTTTTDANGNYTLYAPIGAAIRIIETNPTGFRSTGGTVGTSGGTYSLVTDAITFTPALGTTYTNLNFGDVPCAIFTVDNVRTASAGETVFMPHVFTAGTAGTLTFTLSATSNPAMGWSNVLYRDTNGDGILQTGEPIITGALSVTAGQQVAIIAKVFTPLGVPQNSSQTLSIGSLLTYANAPTLTESITRTDLVTISAGSGLILTKSVDKTSAKKGDNITYTISYRNSGNDTIADIRISDTTPAYTTFVSGATGILPLNLTAVATSFPSVGASGALRWTFTGNLPPGGNGTVSFVVRLQ